MRTPTQAPCCRSLAGEAGAQGRCLGKLVSPQRRRQAVQGIRKKTVSRNVMPAGSSASHAGRTIHHHRPGDEDALTSAIISLASRYGRYGYRRVRSLLPKPAGRLAVIASSGSGAVRGLKYPKGTSREGGCGSTTVLHRLRPQHRNHVWSYDFVEAQTHDGRKLRLMTLIDGSPGMPGNQSGSSH